MDSSKKSMRLAVGASLVAMAVYVGFGALGRASTTREPASCGVNKVVHDFLQPFERMVPIRGLPTEGKMPFGPKGLRLELLGGRLLVGGGEVGFGFRDEAIEQRRRLGWLVTTTLSRVSAKGRVIASLDTKRHYLGAVQGNRIKALIHSVPGNPAFYRIDVSFTDRVSGRPLGRYNAYLRVVRPRFNLKVVVEEPTVQPGEMARARLINAGTLQVVTPAYDYGFAIQKHDGASWVTVPDNPPRGRVPKRMQVLVPGAENRGCLRYRVPEGEPPGRFRFVARVGKSLQGIQPVFLSAGFEVVP